MTNWFSSQMKVPLLQLKKLNAKHASYWLIGQLRQSSFNRIRSQTEGHSGINKSISGTTISGKEGRASTYIQNFSHFHALPVSGRALLHFISTTFLTLSGKIAWKVLHLQFLHVKGIWWCKRLLLLSWRNLQSTREDTEKLQRGEK